MSTFYKALFAQAFAPEEPQVNSQPHTPDPTNSDNPEPLDDQAVHALIYKCQTSCNYATNLAKAGYDDTKAVEAINKAIQNLQQLIQALSTSNPTTQPQPTTPLPR
jgi:hypothetical protein